MKQMLKVFYFSKHDSNHYNEIFFKILLSPFFYLKISVISHLFPKKLKADFQFTYVYGVCSSIVIFLNFMPMDSRRYVFPTYNYNTVTKTL